MVSHGDGHKEISLSEAAVGVLCTLNEKRRSEQFDSRFIMVLLIGLYSIKKIIENAAIDEGCLDLVKDLFEWRVMKDKIRMQAFKKLIAESVVNIKSKNYKA